MPPVPAPARRTLPFDVERAKRLLSPVLARLSLAIVFATLSLFVFFKLAHEVTESETLRFDTAILAYFRARQWPPLHAFLYLVSQFAGPIWQTVVVAVATLGFTLRRRFFPDGFALLIASAGGTLLMIGLKRLFHRPRPEVIFDDLGFSFPSGHSFFAVVVYGMLAYWLAQDMSPRRRTAVWALASVAIFLVDFSRVFLGEHFPSDVIAGFAVGVPWLWGCLALPKYFHARGRDTVVPAAQQPLQQRLR